MAINVAEIIHIPDSAFDDDEISVSYSTPVSTQNGTSKSDAISIEMIALKPKPVTLIDLSKNSYFNYVVDYDDDVKILHSIPKTLKRIYKGESSNSKESPEETLSRSPIIFISEICGNEKQISDAFCVQGCNHSYCTDCITKYVASKLQDNITTIGCPLSNCKGYLEPQHCGCVLPKEVFNQWGDALCEAVILGSERFYCLYKNCSSLLIYDRSGSEVIVQSECRDCNWLFCAQCKVPWHCGIECGEYQKMSKDERNNEDTMLMNLAKGNKWMRSPKCRIYVSMSEGCLYMGCRCGFTFCYNCGSPMTGPLHYSPICKH